ncbi:MAG: sugar kinase [Pseudomonadota bacterium]
MAAKRLVAIGECMIEMSAGAGAMWKAGFAGDTLNTAWYARALLPSADWQVSYVTALGDDAHSDEMAAFIRGAGIRTDHIQRIAGARSGLYLISQKDGDRVFTYWRENSAARRMVDDLPALIAGCDGADVLYFSGITLAILTAEKRGVLLDLLAQQRAVGAKIAFDPNIRRVLWESPEICRDVLMTAATHADYIFPSFDDEATLFGDLSPADTAARYHDAGAVEVIVKDGPRPCLIRVGDAVHVVPGDAVSHVVDATGAGDAFNGAWLAARLTGDADIDAAVDAARKAHMIAGIVIRNHGALVVLDVIADGRGI